MSTKEPMERTKEKPYQPTSLDYQIMRYVKEYHFFTAYHLTKLHYADGSKKRASFKLQTLSGNNPERAVKPA